MSRVVLFLFKRDFVDEGRKYFCPYCLRIEGLMAMFPTIRHNVEVRYVDYAKPRGELPGWVGDAEQSCPHLVFPDGDDAWSPSYASDSALGVRRIDKTDDILKYFIERFSLPSQH